MLAHQFFYFAARSTEERALADEAINPAVRSAHLAMAERYEAMAAQADPSDPETLRRSASCLLDMGEASRLEGFRRYGCR